MEPREFPYDGVVITVSGLAHITNSIDGSDIVRLALASGLGDGRFNLHLDGQPRLIEEVGELGASIDIDFEDHGFISSNNQEVEVRLTVNRPATGAPVHHRQAGAGGDADRRHFGHHGRGRRSCRRPVRLPVHFRRQRHRRSDGLHLYAGGSRRGQVHQGAGELHRQRQIPGVLDQRGHRRR